ncbi:uncharacterized protein BX664DRAFT_249830, partial [Halteromyces radiatus]|uniref:uncharacterized protein n=1 Tax=Halteromyces radiatus TaxID=101107 RepID=UPI0022201F1B
DVPQRLEPEQYQYEFPPKSHLQALSVQLDQSLEDSLSFFDASSFTTMSSTCSSRVSSVLTDEFNAQEDQEFNSFLATLEQEQQANGFSLSPPPVQTNLVLDRQLSPLQLPQQVQDMTTRLREESYDSISTITQPIVAPSSFLTRSVPQEQIEWHDTFDDMDYHYDSIHPHHRLSDVDQDIPVIRRPSENVLSDSSSVMDDDSSQFSHDSKVIFIKLNKKNKVASPYIPKRSTTSQSDEGYDDNSYIIEEDEKEMQSDSVFLPLGRQEEDEDSLQRQIDQLQAQVREEKAMRLAFEKAMEEMVLLMDQQQKMLYDRVEQEVSMRQVYEKKMEEALAMVAPLESKLKKETDARCELESMMSHVLGELQELKLAHKSSS